MLKKSLLLAAASMLPISAHAQVTSTTFNLYGTDFTPYFGTPSPLVADPVELSFTLTIDPSTAFDIGPSTSGLSIGAFNLPYNLAYSFDPTGTLIIATYGYPGGCGHDVDSFCAFINDPFGAFPTISLLEQSGASGGWRAQTTTVTVGAGVPEPAAWGMMIGGFALVGGAIRYRRSRTGVSFA